MDESSKEPEKRVQTPAVAKARVKKKSELRKFAEELISDDISHVKSYVVRDVLIPGIKNLIARMGKSAIDMIFGTGGQDKDRERGMRPSYREYYDQNNSQPSSRSYRSGSVLSYDIIYYETREEADYILDQMRSILKDYRFVRVGDLYDLSNVQPKHTDYDIGWRNLSSAQVVRKGDEYYIRLPNPVPERF